MISRLDPPRRPTTRRLTPILALPLMVACQCPLPIQAEPTGDQLTFFENRIRPVLAEKCYKCHSVDAEKLKGGLRVDSRAGLLRGGDTGAAIVPGDADDSLMIESLRYHDPDFQMPPKGKLPDAVVADFEKWVALGAPWPDEPEPVPADGSSLVEAFDLDQRREEHWCWQPITSPALPETSDTDWARDPLDRFILARLEAADLQPAAETDPAAWLRRVHFDLTGLPPTDKQLEEFDTAMLAGDRESAYARTVDALLASPHFGERWARHWMDLARYAETCGHEFDYPIPHASKYRDYLVRAFNADLPYDQLLVEHVAGDRLEEPRRHPDTNTNESIVGTGFWYLHESVHAPTDVRQWESDHIDNRIDALTRGFLGLTVSCARCHDHKFDAISTADYYALSGFLQSSRRTLAPLDPDGRIAAAAAELRSLHDEAAKLLPTDGSDAGQATPLREGESRLPADGWFPEGDAFADVGESRWAPEDPSRVVDGVGIAHGGQLAARAEGALRSPTFELTQPFLHLRLKTSPGAAGQIVRLIIDGYDMNLYHTLLFKGSILKGKPLDTGGKFRWLTLVGDLDKYLGHRVHLEVLDQGEGWVALDDVIQSPHRNAPADPAANADAPALPGALDRLAKTYRETAAKFPKPDYAIAMVDGTPEDEHVFIRGSHQSLGEITPRRFLTALGGEENPAPDTSSGRLALARQMTADDNPLTARVIVNRLWHHLFGRGIVPSVDDFGVMGQPPSHPELLDHLASEFRTAHQWSIKSALRSLVLSSTYRMSSTAHPANDPERLAEIDPENILLHRAPVRRLQAEAIRDAMLAVSGQLDRSLGGASVPVHLTSFMEGRGRPKNSGPVDGNRRRSLYLEVRRNFLNPFLLAFDMPSPFSAMGRRSVSNVPSQSLALMNDPFVIGQSQHWADALLAERADDRERLSLAYRQAFAREPSDNEALPLLAYLGSAPDHRQAWVDLCHILFNKKEFIYLR